MKAGIVGLPQAGTTTLFNALTGAHGEVGGYHPGEHVDVATVRVPDERLRELEDLFQPKEVIPATIQFEDIGGVFAHLTGGEHSGRAVAALREADAVLMVLRCFESPFVAEVFGQVDPLREYRAMAEEMLLADLEVIEKRLSSIEADLKKPVPEREELERERDLLQRCQRAAEQQSALTSVEINEVEQKMLRSYSFLTLKPRICVLNIDEDQIPEPPQIEEIGPQTISVCAELEMEIMELDEEERELFLEAAGLEEPAVGRIIRACYEEMGLRSFFTYVSDKLRAWTVQAGTGARAAAGKIHSDMEKGFIRAEVVSFEELQECGSLKDARASGKLRMEGKDYEVQDGDIITFHFSR
ncbi:MAG: redox-regulated ATPase YchF [Candidatus Brocadiaceae bacterium]